MGKLDFRHAVNDMFDWTGALQLRHRGTMVNHLEEMYRANSCAPVDVGAGVVAREDRDGGERLSKKLPR